MFKELDPILHSQLRLSVMSLLISVKEAEFTFIRGKTNATAGNLSVQVNKLKEAHKAEDIASIDKAAEELNAAWQAASQHMYAAGNEGAAQGGGDGQQQQQQSTGNNDGGVADAEYEEVK